MVHALQCFLKSLCIIVNINDQILAVILILLCSVVSIWTDGHMNLLQFYSLLILLTGVMVNTGLAE